MTFAFVQRIIRRQNSRTNGDKTVASTTTQSQRTLRQTVVHVIRNCGLHCRLRQKRTHLQLLLPRPSDGVFFAKSSHKFISAVHDDWKFHRFAGQEANIRLLLLNKNNPCPLLPVAASEFARAGWGVLQLESAALTSFSTPPWER